MFCPECKAEYRPGFHRCADCDVDLVESLSRPDGGDFKPEEAGRPDLASTRHFLAWFVPIGIYALTVFIAIVRPYLRGNLYFVAFLVCLHIALLNGDAWMVLHALKHERKRIRYVLLALIPFMFVWYALVRVPIWKKLQGNSPSLESNPEEATIHSLPSNVADESSSDNMFCPLCKAEFRAGFTQCSDCHIPLLPSKLQALRVPVARAWKGGDKSEFEAVLTALQNAGIPLRFREHLNARNAVKMSFLGMMGYVGRTSDTEFEVRIRQSDAARAAEAVREALTPDEDDDES